MTSPNLTQLVQATQQAVSQAKKELPINRLSEEVEAIKTPTRPFYPLFAIANDSPRSAMQQTNILAKKIIAEIKFASPSAGTIYPHTPKSSGADYVNEAGAIVGDIARAYEQAGATCISVLTERSAFGGHPSFLKRARENTAIPILKKDFIVDEWQVLKARLDGADAILVIVGATDTKTTVRLVELAHQIGLSVLLEVHTGAEMATALENPAFNDCLIGINNRNLRTLQTRPNWAVQLCAQNGITRPVIAASGYTNSREMRKAQVQTYGAITGFLVGESLMRTGLPGGALKAIFAS